MISGRQAITVTPGQRWAFVSALAYTAVAVMLRVAAPAIDPALGSLLRLLPVAVVAWTVLALRRFRELRPSDPAFLTRRFIVALLVGGSMSFVLGNILYFAALNHGGLGITAGAAQSGSVLGGLWIGYLAVHERPWREQVLGAAIIVAGLVAIAAAQTRSVGELWWLGLLFALAAGSTYALSNTMSRMVQRERPLLFATLAVSSFGGLAPLVAITLLRLAAGQAIQVNAASAGAVLLAGCANAVALASLALAVRTSPVATVNTISSSSVVFSFVAAVLVFGETGTPPMVLGIVLVTIGIVVAQVRRSRAVLPVSDAPA